MNLPSDKKPSLNDLFESKKLDIPDKGFWDDFQNQVRSKTLSSVVAEGESSRYKKIVFGTTFSILFFSLCFWIVSLRNENSVIIAENSKISTITLSNHNLDNSSIANNANIELIPVILQVLESENSSELKKATFVEQNFLASALESSFQHRTLVSDVEYSDESMVQFTF